MPNLNTRQISNLVGQLRSPQIPCSAVNLTLFRMLKKKKTYHIPTPKTEKTSCITDTSKSCEYMASPDKSIHKKINAH